MWTRRRRTRRKPALFPSRALFPSLFPWVAVAAAGALLAGVSRIDAGEVKVGDIIAFEPDPSVWIVPQPAPERIAVHRAGAYGCVLDLAVLRHSGGSLVTEARLAAEGHSFRLHWAGERTAADAGDCGPSADLIIDRTDLRRLAKAAAGGFPRVGPFDSQH